MSFPLGKPILLMLVVALFSGAAITLREPPAAKDLVVWLFADVHADTYRSIVADFERRTGKTVDIQLLNGRAMPVRLETMFMSGTSGRPLPDVVELEINWVGRFFRAPVDEVGLLPLNDLLRQSGWDRRIVRSRFTPWSKRGVIFGVPHDVHPVSITYRKDLFDEAGIDLESATTWVQFQEMCLAFQHYWRERGYPFRHAMELPQSSPDCIIAMLLQRGIHLVDDREQSHLTDPRVAQTIAFYAQLVAGPRRIASESAGGTGLRARDLIDGNLCSFITPDWLIYSFKTYAPQLEGKLRMMPLPRFDPEDANTSTWGGTMIGITRNAADPALAWQLIEFLYLSDTGLRARQRVTNILPPVIEQWDDPAYHRPDPYFGGQKVDELYIDLARQVPDRYVTPVSNIVNVQLSLILNRAVAHVRQHGHAGLEERCRQWLMQAEEDLRRRIEHGNVSE
jgi:arabinosaccharide transport system substrate-binding protein